MTQIPSGKTTFEIKRVSITIGALGRCMSRERAERGRERKNEMEYGWLFDGDVPVSTSARGRTQKHTHTHVIYYPLIYLFFTLFDYSF